MAIPYLACMAAAAAWYHLPPRVLPAIQSVERGAVMVVHRNTDGSADLGVMQVNTRWIAALSHYARMPEKSVRVRLIDDPCFNIAAAALIMAAYLSEEKGDLLRAVGDYHSHTPALNLAYRNRVLASARAMFR